MAWTRQTAWRQGSVLRAQDATKLGILEEYRLETHIAMVISHDCDLVIEDLNAEPWVEVITGTRISKCKPECSHGQSARVLHLELNSGNQIHAFEFSNVTKKYVSKADLANALPDYNLSISNNSKRTLQAWLAARYKRAAFPESLAGLLNDVKEAFVKEGKKNPAAILGIYIEYEPESELVFPEELYELRVIVVYSAEAVDAEAIAKASVAQIQAKFSQKFKSSGKWQGIELRSCVALSEGEFTYYDIRRMKQFRLDYLSLRSNLDTPDTDV